MAFFPWMGFTAGPLVGRAIADLALGRRPSHDISAFAPGA
jgi:glycine/D-amino acid oxidase-like deaminating enzyme